MSQPAVSMQVRKLEEALGVTLVQQVGRQIYLTESGQLLREYAARIFNLVHEAETALAELEDLQRGRVVLAATPAAGTYLLPPLLARFRAVHPGIEMQLSLAPSRTVLERIARGDADVGIVDDTIDPGATQELDIDLLVPDDMHLVVYPTHPFAGAGPVPAFRLAGESFILPESGTSLRTLLDARFAQRSLRLRSVLELNSFEAIKHAVAAGLGIAILSGYAITWEVAADKLVSVPVTDLDLHGNLYIARHRERHLTRAANAVVELLRTEAEPVALRSQA